MAAKLGKKSRLSSSMPLVRRARGMIFCSSNVFPLTLGISGLDSTSMHMLQELLLEYRAKKIHFLYACIKGNVRGLMKTSGFTKMRTLDIQVKLAQWRWWCAGLEAEIGLDSFFLTIHDAVEYALAELQGGDQLHPVKPAHDQPGNKDFTEKGFDVEAGDRLVF